MAGLDPPEGAAQTVRLDCGVPLAARVTRRSAKALGLAPGLALHAVIKSVALDRSQERD